MPNNIPTDVLNTGITSNHIAQLEDWGKHLAGQNPTRSKMSTSQIRKFFGEMKRIQADFDTYKSDIVLLDPKIAYAVGRAKKDARNQHVPIEDFYKMISPMIRTINGDKAKYKIFVQVCEAIVAYHKANGGDQ